MKTNLHNLACELARKDAPGGFNADVISTETALAALGKKLRSVGWIRALRIFRTIWKHAGK